MPIPPSGSRVTIGEDEEQFQAEVRLGRSNHKCHKSIPYQDSHLHINVPEECEEKLHLSKTTPECLQLAGREDEKFQGEVWLGGSKPEGH